MCRGNFEVVRFQKQAVSENNRGQTTDNFPQSNFPEHQSIDRHSARFPANKCPESRTSAGVSYSLQDCVATTTLPANFINNQQLKITIPAANTAAAATLILKVQNPDGTTSNEYSLPVTAPQLIVSAIAPARGAIGSTVTIFGTGFAANAGGNVVTFTGSVAATIQSATTTTLTVTVPTGAQTGAVQVAVGTRTASTSTFTVGQTPDQDFAFGANAAQVILYQGSTTSVDVQLNNAGSAAYTNLAKLAVSGAAAGVTAAPSRPYLSNGQACRHHPCLSKAKLIFLA